MNLDFTSLVLLLLVFQIFFLSYYLFSRSRERPSNQFAGLFFVAIGASTIDSLLLRTGFWYQYPSMAMLTSGAPLLYGPLLMFYSKSLLINRERIKIKDLLHLLPFTIITLLLIGGYHFQARAEQIEILHRVATHHISGISIAAMLGMVAHFGGYATYSLVLVKRHEKQALNQFSDHQRTNLSWLKATIKFLMILLALSLVNDVFEVGSANLGAWSLAALSLLLFYFINRVIYTALYIPTLFSEAYTDENRKRTALFNSAFKAASTDELTALEAYMAVHKPYLNADLTLNGLATELGYQARTLSKLINAGRNQNFFDFINQYRVQEAALLLSSTKGSQLTVLEILYKTGFNSKSSFNTLFKRYTGKTPSAYKSASQLVSQKEKTVRL